MHFSWILPLNMLLLHSFTEFEAPYEYHLENAFVQSPEDKIFNNPTEDHLLNQSEIVINPIILSAS
jgi:hypothetical protein